MFKMSHTMRAAWKSCPKKVYWKYSAGIVPKAEDNTSRAIGRAFHFALQRHRLGDKFEDVIDNSRTQLALQLGDIGEDIMTTKELEKDLTLEEVIEDHMTRLEAYFIGYVEKFSDMDAKLKWKPEVKFDNGSDRGYIDGIAEIEGHGTYIIEDKTTGVAIPEDQHFALAMDDQLMTYVIGLMDSGCDNFRGIVYRQTLKSQKKRKKNESGAEYYQRIVEEYKTQYDNKYKETLITFSPEAIEEYRQEIIRVNTQIAHALGTHQYYRNSGACFSKFGRCDYLSACSGMGCEGTYKATKHEPLDDGHGRNIVNAEPYKDESE